MPISDSTGSRSSDTCRDFIMDGPDPDREIAYRDFNM
jgi:hypothetical protein